MMASENEIYLFRLIAFLLRIVPLVIHDFMESQYFGFLSFEAYLNKHKHVLFHLTTLRLSSQRCCQCGDKDTPTYSRCIAENQFDLLFARTGNTVHNRATCICMFNAKADIDKSRLDISLAICILTNCESVDPKHERHLNIIRKIRNDVFHSPSTNVITGDMFIVQWDGLTRAIKGLTSAMNLTYSADVMMQIESLKDESFVGDETAKLATIWFTVTQTMQENTKEILGKIENNGRQILDVVNQNTVKLNSIHNMWSKKEILTNSYNNISQFVKTTEVSYDKNQTVNKWKTLIPQAIRIKRQEKTLKYLNEIVNDEKTDYSYDMTACYDHDFINDYQIYKKVKYDTHKSKNTFQPETEHNKLHQIEEIYKILVAIGQLKIDNRTQIQQLREHIDTKIEGVTSLIIQMLAVISPSKRRNHRRSRSLANRRHEKRFKYLPPKRRYKRYPRQEKSVNEVNNNTVSKAHPEDGNILVQKRCSTCQFANSKINSSKEKFSMACSKQASTVTKTPSLTPKFVFIKDCSGRYIEITLHQWTTTIDIKQQIQSKTKFPVGNQKLIYGGKVLDDRVSVITYGISENSNVYMTPQDNTSVERNMPKLVWMRHIESRKVRQIDIIPFQRIIDLKLWVRQKLGISMHQGIVVIFSGETLKNYEYFEVVGIQANDTIYWDYYTLQGHEEDLFQQLQPCHQVEQKMKG